MSKRLDAVDADSYARFHAWLNKPEDEIEDEVTRAFTNVGASEQTARRAFREAPVLGGPQLALLALRGLACGDGSGA